MGYSEDNEERDGKEMNENDDQDKKDGEKKRRSIKKVRGRRVTRSQGRNYKLQWHFIFFISIVFIQGVYLWFVYTFS